METNITDAIGKLVEQLNKTEADEESRISTLYLQLCKSNQLNEELKEKVSSLNLELDEAKRIIAKQNKETSSHKKEARNHKKNLEKLVDLENTLKKKNNKLKSINERLNEAKHDSLESKNQLQIERQKTRIIKDKSEKLLAQIARCSDQIVELEKINSENKSMISNNKQRLASADDSIASYKEEIHELQVSNELRQNTINNLKDANSNLTLANTNIQHELTVKNTEQVMLFHRCEELNKEKKALKGEISQSLGFLNELKSNYDSAKAELAKERDNLISSTRIIEDQQNEIEYHYNQSQRYQVLASAYSKALAKAKVIMEKSQKPTNDSNDIFNCTDIEVLPPIGNMRRGGIVETEALLSSYKEVIRRAEKLLEQQTRL